jgi:hypothetical protein
VSAFSIEGQRDCGTALDIVPDEHREADFQIGEERLAPFFWVGRPGGGGSGEADGGGRDHVDCCCFSVAAAAGSDEKSRALREEGALDDCQRAGDDGALAFVVGSNIAEPFIGKEPDCRGNGTRGAVAAAWHEGIELLGYAEDDAVFTVEAAAGEDGSVVEHDWQLSDRRRGRQSAIVTFEVVSHEWHRQVHGPAFVVDIIDMAFDQLGELHFVERDEEQLLGSGQSARFICRRHRLPR